MRESSEPVQTDAETREFLSKVIKQGILEFKPMLDKDGVRYVEVEENLTGSDPVYIEKTLENLERKGVLESRCVDRVLTCPYCGSPDVHAKYTCRKCGSYSVDYTELIEHMKCGYIGSKDKFVKNGALVCPGCQAGFDEDSKGSAYREIGSCYQCEKCGYRFDKPEIAHSCQKCGRFFTHQEARYIKICAYRIADAAINELGRDLPILRNIEKTLSDKGFRVRLRSQVEGTSGVQHSFDVLAKRNGTRLVIDVSMTGETSDMITLLGKKVDVNPTKALIVDLSNQDKLTPLGKVYDITVLKASDSQDLQNQLEELLATLN